MALEFASKKETFPRYKVFETELAGRPFVVETGKMCGLSNGSCLVRYGETAVLCNVTMSDKPRDGIDFFPLSVDFEEKLYSVGRIPGSFMRREGRPGEKAVLTSRVVDRPIRPLFPKERRLCGDDRYERGPGLQPRNRGHDRHVHCAFHLRHSLERTHRGRVHGPCGRRTGGEPHRKAA